nr:immunoglobulin light chain junction region [Macaca mulatta]
CLQGYSAPRTF